MDSAPEPPAQDEKTRPARHEAEPHTESSRPNGQSLSAPSSEFPHSAPVPAEAAPARSGSVIPAEMPRVFAIVFGLAAIVIGVVITALPWNDAWLNNSLLDGYAALRNFLMNNFVRGVVSGLGVIDIWVGVSEVLGFKRGQGKR